MQKLDEVDQFITDHTSSIKKLRKEMQLAWWGAYTTGKDEYYARYERLYKEIKKLYNSKEDFEKVKGWSKLDMKDQLMKRQFEVMYNDYLMCQGDTCLINEIVSKETAVEKKFNNFRAKLNQIELTDNQIKCILKTETSSEKLREAWEANKKQGKLIEQDVLEIVRLRNKLARSQGFENYYVMALQAGEQNPADVKRLFEELKASTDAAFEEVKAEIDEYLSRKLAISKNELKPWHYVDLFFQEVPGCGINLDKYYTKDVVDIAKKFYADIGLNVQDILNKSDLYEKKGKSQHAFAVDVDREGDVRILVNTENNEHWMCTTLHELGHAVYQKFIGLNVPFLIRDNAHTLVTEAIAMLFGRQSQNSAFIKDCANSAVSVSGVQEEVYKAQRREQIVFSRWTQVMVNFERQLYENPEQDLNRLWWDLVKEHQHVDFFRDEPDWAAKIHLTTTPVYYHNYMLAELLASQLHNVIAKRVLKLAQLKNVSYCGKKAIGEYLRKQIFMEGAKYKWNELIKKATGEVLSPEYWVKEFINE